ncbi:MAG: TlyA family RNA methyltransferase [Candidatus Caenarcaniphilales bacterium]|jgi:23S rRNA (cytidine1920-2'-O)/16S rRNA (cytidine1409-2'-O)-methyltransferase|nr:TlyA family RNA methyltransferase [Candidatus Caenarcaniphilales bacterium]
MAKNNKIRLDDLLVELGFFESKNQAQTCIISRGVSINGQVFDKPGHKLLADTSNIEVKDKILEYVSRGAYKLKAAHQAWRLDFTDKVILDIGASTGGFTDYALKQGARLSLAIDVGHGQLHYKLQKDSRVINLEKTNFRDFDFESIAFEEKISFVVIDVSFISLVTILERLKFLIQKSADNFSTDLIIIALLKPQFEAGKEIMDKCKGVISDEKIRKEVFERTVESIKAIDYKLLGEPIESPIKGAKGNIEYLLNLYFSC